MRPLLLLEGAEPAETDLTRRRAARTWRGSLGPLEILNLSGWRAVPAPGPGPRSAAFFVRNNGVKQIYCPTNGYVRGQAPDRSARGGCSRSRDLLTCSPSSCPWTACPEFHNEFRNATRTPSQKAMETYDMRWRSFQRREPRLADPRHLDGDRREPGGDPAAHDLPVRALPRDEPPQHRHAAGRAETADAGGARGWISLPRSWPSTPRESVVASASRAGSAGSSIRCCTGGRNTSPSSSARPCRAPPAF